MARKMKVKFDKYLGDCNLLISIAAILDPRNKMQLVTFCFDAIYSKEEASKYIKVVRDSLYEIYQEYADAYVARVEKSNNTKNGQDENSDSLSRFSKGKLGSQKGRQMFDQFMRTHDTVAHVNDDNHAWIDEGEMEKVNF
ncbi:DUF4413 domain-containing protein [Canna indica]|uniref:DUF4413 domain-containing protein n=1 Tax=Canna indica TaxID=4628 RepID=A0AAQ3KYU5_9LILI|nr:DUF4413 domain-containing protein [Canna indica]